MSSLPPVDWEAAAASGRLLVPPGPSVTDDERIALVADLRLAADEATAHVAAATGLPGPATSQVLIVDRRSWITSNVGMAKAMLAPFQESSVGRATLAERVAARFAGGQVGGVFAFVGTRVLGQFDPFSAPARLLLVAPNIVGVERSLGVDVSDFRRWVCLHEETHRFQFGAAPWLPGHLQALIGEVLATAPNALAGWTPARARGLADLVVSPAQREGFDKITAVMSVMEGHADVVMDLAGERTLATVARLREVFEHRRDRGGLAQLIGKLLGLGLKREQYREGATFCRAVLAAGGMETLNQVFESPGLLPSLAEVRDPQQWLHRMG